MLIRDLTTLRVPCTRVAPEEQEEIRLSFERVLQEAAAKDLMSVTAPEVGFQKRAFAHRGKGGAPPTIYWNPTVFETLGKIERFPIAAPYTGGASYWFHAFPRVRLHHGFEPHILELIEGDLATVTQHDLALLAGRPVLDIGAKVERTVGETIGSSLKVTTSLVEDARLFYPAQMRNAPCWCGSLSKWKRCHGRPL